MEESVVKLALAPIVFWNTSPTPTCVLRARCSVTAPSAIRPIFAAASVGGKTILLPDLFSTNTSFSTGPGPGSARQTDFNSIAGWTQVNRSVS